MRDDLRNVVPSQIMEAPVKGRSLHALGAFYLRQGFPKQALSLLLAAKEYGTRDVALDRGIAHAYLLCGAPKKTLGILDALEPSFDSDALRDGARILRSRALLALGHVTEAQDVYAGVVARQRITQGRKP